MNVPIPVPTSIWSGCFVSKNSFILPAYLDSTSTISSFDDRKSIAHGLLRILIGYSPPENNYSYDLDKTIPINNPVEEYDPVIHIFKTFVILIPLDHRNCLYQGIPLHAFEQVAVERFSVVRKPLSSLFAVHISIKQHAEIYGGIYNPRTLPVHQEKLILIGQEPVVVIYVSMTYCAELFIDLRHLILQILDGCTNSMMGIHFR